MKPRPAVPTPMPRLPDPTNVDLENVNSVKDYLSSLNSALAQHLQQRPPVGSSQASRLFTSPNGTTFKVTVTDAGAILAEEVGSTNLVPMPPI